MKAKPAPTKYRRYRGTLQSPETSHAARALVWVGQLRCVNRPGEYRAPVEPYAVQGGIVMFDFRRAFGVCVAIAMLAGCGGSQPVTASPSTGAQSATRSAGQSLQGYYLATLTTQVGSGLPNPSLCIRFKSSGRWSSGGSENFNGTYLISGKDLFASGVWLPSPAVYMYLAGSVNAKQGSGKFIIPGTSYYLSGGGTFTMTRTQSKTCS